MGAYYFAALYGKPYVQAAKDTWGLFKDRGIDALVNDQLVSMSMSHFPSYCHSILCYDVALTWGAYAVGLLCSLFGYLYLRYTHPDYNANGQYTAPVVLFAFLIGLQCCMALLFASPMLMCAD
jgi:hypothetical protein